MTIVDIDAARAIADGTWPELSARLDAEDSARHQRLTSATALAEAAAWYAGQGVAIFPLRPRLKTPLTANGFKDATADPARIAAWWQRWPQANIGAPTGITFDVVDIDGLAGILAITPYIDDLRAQSIGHVSTPRPGGHHWYLPASARKNSAGKLLPGVDTRGAGGYVVLPPSVTDEHGPGRRYTWLRPLVVA